MVFPRTARTTQSVREGFTEPTVDVIIFSWCSRGFIHFIYFIHFDNFIHLINSFIHSFIHSWFKVSFIHRKKPEEVDFVNEEFLHWKICSTFWCATEDISKNACS